MINLKRWWWKEKKENSVLKKGEKDLEISMSGLKSVPFIALLSEGLFEAILCSTLTQITRKI